MRALLKSRNAQVQDSDTVAANGMPTSFGVFKPVGYVMLGLPTQEAANAAVTALRASGWLPAEVLHFEPRDSVAELTMLVEQAGPLAGFGAEIALLRRYLELARLGTCWLLVKADDSDRASAAAALAHACGATLGIYYRSLVVEDLI